MCAESNALATRACSGQAERRVGTRRPSTRSAPSPRSATSLGRSAGSSEASASQTATIGAVAASIPAATAAPNPLRAFEDHGRTCRASHLGRAVRRSVVDDDRAVPLGNPAEHPRQRRRLVQAREDEIDVSHDPTLGSPGFSVPAKVLRNADGCRRCRSAAHRRAYCEEVIAEASRTLGNEDLIDRRVLVVDDDPTVAEVVAEYLRSAGFVVDRVADGFEAIEAEARISPDLIVLDRMLPGIDGIEACRRIRRTSATPIILLTALGSEDERIRGFEAGADDYLTKPFSPRELVLRVQSVLRRSLGDFAPESSLDRGPFHIDPAARVAMMNGRLLSLTVREFDLLVLPREAPSSSVQPRGAAHLRVGVDVRRLVHGDGARAAPSREDRTRLDPADAARDGLGCRLPPGHRRGCR